ncbi:unnamed protein product [Thelazia callipaeda]|uniref:Estradiol 17-beta-dehydrogenase 12 n=1 Tax=Thelazia callipaeda TaxID=103827 RepID=A0A0N5DAN3_THECL|nr:unnamed protein product [Thelazia callipaeda]
MVCQCVIASLGWAFLVFLISRLAVIVFNLIYPFFIATPINLLKAAGSKWAVVTGSTDGIGKAYASELARRGFSIVLISRTQSRLDDVKKEILAESNVEVKTVAFDFTTTNVGEYEKTILPLFDELEVGILGNGFCFNTLRFNNVGVSFNYPELMHKAEGGLQKLADVDIVNTLPVTLLSAAVLPSMIERNSGIIVNISSAVSYSPLDMLSVYSASKKYVTWLSKILQKECAKTNIIVQTICPMLVTTKMSKVELFESQVSRPSFFIVKAEDFVKSAIGTIGIVAETTGCFAHQIEVEIIKNLPEWLVVPFLSEQTKIVRKKALAKKARDAAAAAQE